MEYMAIVSTAMQALGAISSAGQASANYKAQAQASAYNAAVSRNNAQAALQESSAAQVVQQRRARQMAGYGRAAAAQAGAGFGGSAGDILDHSSLLAELDTLNIAYEGQLRAGGLFAQASLDDYYGGVARTNARSARTAGYFGAATALGRGASRLLTPGTQAPAPVEESSRRLSVLTGGSGRPNSALNVFGLRYGSA